MTFLLSTFVRIYSKIFKQSVLRDDVSTFRTEFNMGVAVVEKFSKFLKPLFLKIKKSYFSNPRLFILKSKLLLTSPYFNIFVILYKFLFFQYYKIVQKNHTFSLKNFCYAKIIIRLAFF
jgi:hypothetical protein